MISILTLNGPGGLKVHLDASEIFPDDPGAGTPALVKLRVGQKTYSASYWCAADTGELDCGDHQLTQNQCDWLNDIEDQVNGWIERHTREA